MRLAVRHAASPRHVPLLRNIFRRPNLSAAAVAVHSEVADGPSAAVDIWAAAADMREAVVGTRAAAADTEAAGASPLNYRKHGIKKARIQRAFFIAVIGRPRNSIYLRRG
jgi:hypothetical protein